MIPGSGILRLEAIPVTTFLDPRTDRMDVFDNTIRRELHFESGKIQSKVSYDKIIPNLEHEKGFAYGMFEIRCKLPTYGNGKWPAFWLFCGQTEIDIFDNLYYQDGRLDEQTIRTAIHKRDNVTVFNGDTLAFACNRISKKLTLSNLSNSFNTYTAVWTPEKITIFFNSRELFTMDKNTVPTFKNNVHIIASMQMARWASKNSGPTYLDIDYIRVLKPTASSINDNDNSYYNTPYILSNSEYINHKINEIDQNYLSKDFGSIATGYTNEIFHKNDNSNLVLSSNNSNNGWTSSIIPFSSSDPMPNSLIRGDINHVKPFNIIVYKGEDNRLQYFQKASNGWFHSYIDNNWNTLSFTVSQAPGSITSSNTGEIIYIGADSRIHKYKITSNGWTHEYIGIPSSYNTPSNGAFAKGDIIIDNNTSTIFYKGNDDRIQFFYKTLDGTYEHGWVDSFFGTENYKVSDQPGAIVLGDNATGTTLYYRGLNDDILHSFSYINNSWSHNIIPHSYNNGLGSPNADKIKSSLIWDYQLNRLLYVGYDGRIQIFNKTSTTWYHSWLDDYFNTDQFISFNSLSNNLFSSSLSLDNQGRIFYCNKDSRLSYFEYEACEAPSTCNSSNLLPIIDIHRNSNIDDSIFNENQVLHYEKTNFSLTPNPSNDYINISIRRTSSKDNFNYEYKIYSQTGILKKNGLLNSNLQRIEISELNSGLYYINMHDKYNSYSIKFIKE